MYYEINVAFNGSHLFATHGRSLTDEIKMRHLYMTFLLKFPESDGYKVTVTQFTVSGKTINPIGE